MIDADYQQFKAKSEQKNEQLSLPICINLH